MGAQKIFLKKQEYLEFLRAQMTYYLGKNAETEQIHSEKVKKESKNWFRRLLSKIGFVQLGLSSDDWGWYYRDVASGSIMKYKTVLMHEKELIEVPDLYAEDFWWYKETGQIYDKVLLKYIETRTKKG